MTHFYVVENELPERYAPPVRVRRFKKLAERDRFSEADPCAFVEHVPHSTIQRVLRWVSEGRVSWERVEIGEVIEIGEVVSPENRGTGTRAEYRQVRRKSHE